MRAMENAAQEAGTKLGITVIESTGKHRTWGQIAGSMNEKIKLMPRGLRGRYLVRDCNPAAQCERSVAE